MEEAVGLLASGSGQSAATISAAPAKMRYSEMPRDISCDSLKPLRINETVWDSDEESEVGSSSGCGGGKSGMPMPMCARGTSPPSSVYRKVVQETQEDHSDGIKALTKAACSYGLNYNKALTKAAIKYGTLPRSHGHKSMTLPAAGRGINDDGGSLIHDMLRVSPEDLATQITLLDFPSFKAIKPDELTCCGWTKKNKVKLAPNVVELTRRFNHVSFWVQNEILNAGGAKSRSEMMSHFIKVAKKLSELSNFHSQFAIISALQSAPIYRLSKTWAGLHRRDRQNYDKMQEFFSDKNNWEQLRSCVNSLKLPMIPYLGMFLTDLVYIDMAHPHFGGLESEQRQLKMNNILRMLADYQQSDYSSLPQLLQVQSYLASVRYIEELQKFVEDDHYKLSLTLEPNTPSSTHNASKDSVADAAAGVGSLTLSPARKCSNTTANNNNCQTQGGHQSTKFVPGHRKARSLGTNIFKGCGGAGITDRCDSFTSLGGQHDPGCPSAQGAHGSRHLLDDSELEAPPQPLRDCTSPPHTLTRTWSGLSSDSEEVVFEMSGEECGVQGPLRRKTIIKDGRRPPVASYHRYWVQLWGGSLVYYHPKSLTSRGIERGDFKTAPCKLQHLKEPKKKIILTGPQDAQTQPDVFQLSDPAAGTVYKFRAPSISAARSWISNLQHALEGHTHTPPDLITFE